MALSNKFGWMLVATGNKSELSVGYATLYGDMAGGFALLKDVYKTDVFRLAHYLNERAGKELIPQSIIDRAPSAELRDNQLDEDSLPPYPELDKVLEEYVEHDRSLEELSEEAIVRYTNLTPDEKRDYDRAQSKLRQRLNVTDPMGWWSSPAVRLGMELIKQHKPQAILVTMSPFTAARAGMELKRRTGVRLDSPDH